MLGCSLLAVLSRDAEFMQLECNLTREQEAVYNAAVVFWKVNHMA